MECKPHVHRSSATVSSLAQTHSKSNTVQLSAFSGFELSVPRRRSRLARPN